MQVDTHRDYLAGIFRRCVLAVVGARVPEETVFEKGMLDELVARAEEYFGSLIAHLQRLSAMQRRLSPSAADLALLLHLNQINVVDLLHEAQLMPEIENSKPVDSLNSLYFDPDEEDVAPASRVFFDKPNVLVESTRLPALYMPSWMPPLPADHTYMHSESHSSHVRDLREVRVSLVEEGRLAERALQRLLGDKGSASIISLRQNLPESSNDMVFVDTQQLADLNREIREDGGDGDEIAPDNFDPGHLDVIVKDEIKEEVVEPPRPLRLQLNLGRRPTDSASPGALPGTPPPDDSRSAKKLSLKLSLGKKKKAAPWLGPRPRRDILSMAKNIGHEGDVQIVKVKEEEVRVKPRSSFRAAMEASRSTQ